MSCHGNNFFFTVVGVFPVELLTYQVSIVFAANCTRYRYLQTCYIIGLSVCGHQSSNLHVLIIFQI